MKKAALLGLLLMLSAPVASAETVKDSVKSASEKAGNFWSKEGERSGLKESTSSWGNFWSKANPVNFFQNQQNAYNARKGGVAK